MPDQRRVPRRAGPHRHRQAAEVQAARAVLVGPGAPGQLTRHRRLPLALALVLGALVALVPGLAGAHTQVQDSTPSPGETVSGTVDAVEVDWLDPLLEAPEITVTGPDGGPVPGLAPAELVADDVARATFDPLTEAGTYQVTYGFASRDGAQQEGSHTFRFEPGGGGGIELRPALAVVVGLVVLGLAVRAVQTR